MEQKITPLTITTPAGSYDIIVGAGALATLPQRLDALKLRGKLWLVSDAAVYDGVGHVLEAQLADAGYVVQSFAVPSGEQSKDFSMVMRLYTWMLEGGVERRDTVLALGGGVVGDLAGFVAATVLRGIAFVQLPTTLLAMVDSALGGKTGVNHPHGKNLIGAFHQPRLVLSDTAMLATLSPRELNVGWAETIKHGVIRDAGLFEQLEAASSEFKGSSSELPENTIQNSTFKTQNFAELVQRAAKVKVDVVNADERETGERMLLNYGHTLGHAIEAAAGYGTLLHGEAVAIGMHLEAQLAAKLGMINEDVITRQEQLLHVYGLSTVVPSGMTSEEIIGRTLRDKKVSAGRIRWALPTAIGASVIRDDVPEALVREVLASA